MKDKGQLFWLSIAAGPAQAHAARSIGTRGDQVQGTAPIVALAACIVWRAVVCTSARMTSRFSLAFFSIACHFFLKSLVIFSFSSSAPFLAHSLNLLALFWISANCGGVSMSSGALLTSSQANCTILGWSPLSSACAKRKQQSVPCLVDDRRKGGEQRWGALPLRGVWARGQSQRWVVWRGGRSRPKRKSRKGAAKAALNGKATASQRNNNGNNGSSTSHRAHRGVTRHAECRSVAGAARGGHGVAGSARQPGLVQYARPPRETSG